MTPEVWSIISSIVSVILGILAIGISIWFFMEGRKTETNVSSALTEIKTQTDMLQKISSRQLDRLTKYVTEPKDQNAHESFKEILQVVAQIPISLSASFKHSDSSADMVALRNELINCYIAIYFYSAQTNFWSQVILPDAAEFDQSNEFHRTCKKVVDMSAADFDSLAKILAKCSPEQLNNAALNHLLEETKNKWRNLVEDSSQVYERRARG